MGLRLDELAELDAGLQRAGSALLRVAPAEVLGPDTHENLRAVRRIQGVRGHRRRSQHELRGAHRQRALGAVPRKRRLHEIHGRAADEAGHEDIGRPAVERLGRVVLLQRAVGECGDAVAQRHCLDLVVGDMNGGHAKPRVQASQLGAQLNPELGIQVGERLVQEKRARMADDGAPHRHSLTLAAGELLGLAVEQLAEVEYAGRLVDPLVDLGLRELTDAQRERDILAHAHVGIERVVLKDHGHVSLAGRNVVDDLAVEAELAGGHRFESGNQAQQGRLAAARGSHEHHELAVVDFEVDVVDGDRAVRKDLADTAQTDRTHRASFTTAAPQARFRHRLSAGRERQL